MTDQRMPNRVRIRAQICVSAYQWIRLFGHKKKSHRVNEIKLCVCVLSADNTILIAQ